MKKICMVLFISSLLWGCPDPNGNQDDNQDGVTEKVDKYPYEMVTIKATTVRGSEMEDESTIFQKGRNVQFSSFKIGKSLVPYDLWYRVRVEAEKLGYKFNNKGRGGTIKSTDTYMKDGKLKYNATVRIGEEPTEATASQPVTVISWVDAVIWCNALSELKGLKPVYEYDGKVVKDPSIEIEYSTEWGPTKTSVCFHADVKRESGGYRLATDAEWELAARGGNSEDIMTWGKGTFYAGCVISVDRLKYFANYKDSGNGETMPINSYEPNSLGLYDMSGNLQEFVYDIYSIKIAVDPAETLVNPDIPRSIGSPYDRGMKNRTVRGGSWYDKAKYCTVGRRKGDWAKATDKSGFRLVCDEKN